MAIFHTNLAMSMFFFLMFFSGDGGTVLTISIGLHTNPTLKHKLHGDVGLNTTFCCFVTIIF